MPNPIETASIATHLVEKLEPLGSGALKSAAGMLSEVLSEASKYSTIRRTTKQAANTVAASSLRNLTFDDFRRQLVEKAVGEQAILDSERPENFIARGSYHAVYRLDKIRGFLLRTDIQGVYADSGARIEEARDYWPEKNIGQAVARLGDGEIVKEVSGEPLGIPFETPWGEWSSPELRGPKVALAASMPQSAYDDFARTLLEMPKRSLQFDKMNPNNVLADGQAGVFNIVDVGFKPDYEPYSLDLLKPLTCNIRKYEGVSTPSPLAPLYRTVIEKSLRAFRCTGLPFRPTDETRDIFRAANLLHRYPS
jgi:hypothetical protein